VIKINIVCMSMISTGIATGLDLLLGSIDY
jgi:hypothetical protein